MSLLQACNVTPSDDDSLLFAEDVSVETQVLNGQVQPALERHPSIPIAGTGKSKFHEKGNWQLTELKKINYVSTTIIDFLQFLLLSKTA